LSGHPEIFHDLQKGNPKIVYPIYGIQKNASYLVANICKGNKIMIWEVNETTKPRIMICPGCVKIRLFGDFLICGAGVFICVYYLVKNSKNISDLKSPILFGGAHVKPLVNLAVSKNIIVSTDKYGCIVGTTARGFSF